MFLITSRLSFLHKITNPLKRLIVIRVVEIKRKVSIFIDNNLQMYRNMAPTSSSRSIAPAGRGKPAITKGYFDDDDDEFDYQNVNRNEKHSETKDKSIEEEEEIDPLDAFM